MKLTDVDPKDAETTATNLVKPTPTMQPDDKKPTLDNKLTSMAPGKDVSKVDMAEQKNI